MLGGYILLLLYLANEQTHHYKRISSITYRIHVNGIRGKSSVTRLIGQILREEGIKTFTKTTGSAARIIDHKGKETIIKRRIATIIEQIDIVKKISKHTPEALVIECMAIQPQLQKVCEEKMIQATIGVLTNVREDHQEKMGWTLEEITHTLCEFIPSNGILVCGEQNPQLIKIIEKRAKEKNTQVIAADDKLSLQDKSILQKLKYIEHEENIVLALKVAEVLGIDKETALSAILEAKPDPGALKIHKKEVNGKQISFINAHAINDKESILKVYAMLKEKGHLDKTNIGILYNRFDRPERVETFADITSKQMKLDAIILLGSYKDITKERLIENGFPEHSIFEPKRENLDYLLQLMSGISEEKSDIGESNIIGMVNIHGEIVKNYIKHFTK